MLVCITELITATKRHRKEIPTRRGIIPASIRFRKSRLIIYIPNYTIYEVKSQVIRDFRSPSGRRAHTSFRALVAISDARAASAPRRGSRERRADDWSKAGAFWKTKIRPFFSSVSRSHHLLSKTSIISIRLTAETPHKYT